MHLLFIEVYKNSLKYFSDKDSNEDENVKMWFKITTQNPKPRKIISYYRGIYI